MVMRTTSGSRSQRPLRADAERNRKHILKVAQKFISKIGPEAPLEEIARLAKVGIGTLYRHFPTRLDLLEAVCEDQKEELIELAVQLQDSTLPEEALLSWLWAVIEKITTFKALKIVLQSEFSRDGGELQTERVRVASVAQVLVERAKAANGLYRNLDMGRLLRLVNAIVSAAEGADEPLIEAKALFEIMTRGLRPTPPIKGRA
jgi:AcrR family transcriptional regulator